MTNSRLNLIWYEQQIFIVFRFVLVKISYDLVLQLDDWLLCKVYLNEKEEIKSKTRLNPALESTAIINTNIDIQQAEYSSASHASSDSHILQQFQ